MPEQEFDFLTFEELERLLRAAEEHEPDWFVMIFCAAKTGLRFGELIELRWTDIDLVVGRLMVKRSFTRNETTTPKNGKSREIPLSPATVSELKQYRHLKGELVFSAEDGERLTHRCSNLALKRACLRAGLRPIGWHSLRHTFASHLVIRGRSLKEVQELLGHSDFQQTLRYAHLAPEAKRAAVATLDEPPPNWQHTGSAARSEESELATS